MIKVQLLTSGGLSDRNPGRGADLNVGWVARGSETAGLLVPQLNVHPVVTLAAAIAEKEVKAELYVTVGVGACNPTKL